MKRLQWADITVEQFLSIYRLSLQPELDDITRLERAVCILFDKTEKQIEEITMREFTSLSSQAAFVLNEEVPGKAKRRIRCGNGKRYTIEYHVHRLRHRQYVEVLVFGEKPIDNMHLIMASIVKPRRGQNEAGMHEKISNDILTAPVIDIYHSAVFFLQSVYQFNKQYPGLFGKPDGAAEESKDDTASAGDDNVFGKRYGWMYSAKQVADFENLTMDQAWELPIRQVLNDLSYLKAYNLWRQV